MSVVRASAFANTNGTTVFTLENNGRCNFERLRIPNFSSNPSSPVKGEIYFNTGDNKLKYWNGSEWK